MKIWPGIKILDRYIIRKFIGTYLFAIAMIIVVVVLFDYVETVSYTHLDVYKRQVRGEYATPAYPLEVGQEIAGRINKGGLWNRKKKLDRYEMRMIVPRWHYSCLLYTSRCV